MTAQNSIVCTKKYEHHLIVDTIVFRDLLALVHSRSFFINSIPTPTNRMATRALLHILQLPTGQYNHDRYGMQWILQANNNNDNKNEKHQLHEGDVVYFPDLQTGAGEFEVKK